VEILPDLSPRAMMNMEEEVEIEYWSVLAQPVWIAKSLQ